MMSQRGRIRLAGSVILVWLTAGTAGAAVARFHYAPADRSGTLCLRPAASGASEPGWIALFGPDRPVQAPPPRPTHVLTFRHPYTGAPVTVPVALPQGTPRVEYRSDRVIYNYGSYTVGIHFLADGTVDVDYNSGLFRGL